MNKKNISLVINTTEGKESISDSFGLRRSSLMNKVPYFTTMPAANATDHIADTHKCETHIFGMGVAIAVPGMLSE